MLGRQSKQRIFLFPPSQSKYHTALNISVILLLLLKQEFGSDSKKIEVISIVDDCAEEKAPRGKAGTWTCDAKSIPLLAAE